MQLAISYAADPLVFPTRPTAPQTYLGWESVPVDGPPVKTCVYPNGTEVGESATYSRLCGPNKFAFMVDVNCKLCSAA